MLKPKWGIHLISNNFFLANHISAPGLNMVIGVLFSYVSICGAVGGGSMAPEAKSFHFVWPFLPYFELGNRCGKEKKDPSSSS